jgi:predicted AlkP superfamily pyrophosphatase or phosphodiesterase
MNRLFVLSIDSLLTEDLAYLATRPAFASILPQAAIVGNVRAIYPTLTYPIHTTLVTGVRPQRHGIPHNQRHGITRDNPDFSILGSDWYWEAEAIQAKTLPQAAREAGLVTGAVLWPVQAGADIDHNLAEIWPARPGDGLREVMEKSCSASVMNECYHTHIASKDWRVKPELDSYGMPCALHILRNHQPHFFLQHIVCLDHDRHVHGVHAPQITQTLNRVDDMVGELLSAMREAGTLDQTNIVILGDHGQIDVKTVFQPNVLLRQAGLIQTDDAGRPTTWDAYAFSAGFSTQIFLRDPADAALVARVGEVLRGMRRLWPDYVERVMTAEEAQKEEGLSGAFSFVLEGTEGTLFHNSLTEPLLQHAHEEGYALYRGMHGHSPDKGPKPPVIFIGPDVMSGMRMETADMLDVCPTLAQLLGVSMPDMEGRPLPVVKSIA